MTGHSAQCTKTLLIVHRRGRTQNHIIRAENLSLSVWVWSCSCTVVDLWYVSPTFCGLASTTTTLADLWPHFSLCRGCAKPSYSLPSYLNAHLSNMSLPIRPSWQPSRAHPRSSQVGDECVVSSHKLSAEMSDIATISTSIVRTSYTPSIARVSKSVG